MISRSTSRLTGVETPSMICSAAKIAVATRVTPPITSGGLSELEISKPSR